MLTGGDRPEALLVPGEAFQVGQTIDGSRGAPRVSHVASVQRKVLRLLHQRLIGEAEITSVNHHKLTWKSKGN